MFLYLITVNYYAFRENDINYGFKVYIYIYIKKKKNRDSLWSFGKKLVMA